ncbi:MAG: hypothetical protein PHO30_02965 [Candidatus Omnitrophica bacterium]|nr:hypothetical protein [Candidatus Omnitrophota bacterium]
MRYYAVIIIGLLVLAAPASLSAAVVGENIEQVRGIADPIFDNILAGFAHNDYTQYSRDFDDSLKETLSETRFLEIKKNVQELEGNYLYREYLGFLNRQEVTIVFWKGAFDKTHDDVLIKMVLMERDGKYFVTGLWYQ